jgi:hypothetical protein
VAGLTIKTPRNTFQAPMIGIMVGVRLNLCKQFKLSIAFLGDAGSGLSVSRKAI